MASRRAPDPPPRSAASPREPSNHSNPSTEPQISTPLLHPRAGARDVSAIEKDLQRAPPANQTPVGVTLTQSNKDELSAELANFFTFFFSLTLFGDCGDGAGRSAVLRKELIKKTEFADLSALGNERSSRRRQDLLPGFYSLWAEGDGGNRRVPKFCRGTIATHSYVRGGERRHLSGDPPPIT